MKNNSWCVNFDVADIHQQLISTADGYLLLNSMIIVLYVKYVLINHYYMTDIKCYVRSYTCTMNYN